MKRETQAKRQETMQKFKFDTQDSGANDLIDEFNDELEAMMGRDKENDRELEAAGDQYKLGQPMVGIAIAGDEPFEFGALEDEHEA